MLWASLYFKFQISNLLKHYRNRKIIVCGLMPDANRQRYIDTFTSLGIGKCPYDIPRTDGRFNCPAKWRRQRDHRNLLANDVTNN